MERDRELLDFYLHNYLMKCKHLCFCRGYTGLALGIGDLTKSFVSEYFDKEIRIKQLTDIFRDSVVSYFSEEASSGRRIWNWESEDEEKIRIRIKNCLESSL